VKNKTQQNKKKRGELKTNKGTKLWNKKKTRSKAKVMKNKSKTSTPKQDQTSKKRSSEAMHLYSGSLHKKGCHCVSLSVSSDEKQLERSAERREGEDRIRQLEQEREGVEKGPQTLLARIGQGGDTEEQAQIALRLVATGPQSGGAEEQRE
jgi:hypothetical protein